MKKFLILYVLCFPLNAYAIPTIVIDKFDDNTGQPELKAFVAGYSDIVTSCLSEYSDKIAIVERVNLDALTNEQSTTRFQKAEAYSGSFLQAGYLVTGAMFNSGYNTRLQAKVIKLPSSTQVGTIASEGNVSELTGNKCSELASQIINITTKNKTDDSHTHITATNFNPQTNADMATGLTQYYQASYMQAAASFMKVLRAEPANTQARYWLASSYFKAGMSRLAVTEAERFIVDNPNHPKTPEMQKIIDNANKENAR